MENNGDLFLPSSELKREDIQDIKSRYIRGALLRDLVITVIMFALVTVSCFFINGLFPRLAMVILIISGALGIFSLAGFITELVVIGLISRGEFTWTTGEVEYYTLHTVRRTTYLYAVVANNYCNTWANPFYSKGTEVYLLKAGSSLISQNIIVSK